MAVSDVFKQGDSSSRQKMDGYFQQILRQNVNLRILNLFNILTLKRVFWKTIAFLRKLEYRFFSSEYYEWKPNIPMQNWPVKSQCYGKLNGEHKTDLLQRMKFNHWPLYLFENLVCPNTHIHSFPKCFSFISRCILYFLYF